MAKRLTYTAYLQSESHDDYTFVAGGSFEVERKKRDDRWEYPSYGEYWHKRFKKLGRFNDWGQIVDQAHGITYRRGPHFTICEQPHGAADLWPLNTDREPDLLCCYAYPDTQGDLYCGIATRPAVGLWGPPQGGKRQGQRQNVEYPVGKKPHSTGGMMSLVVVPGGNGQRKVYALPLDTYEAKKWMCVKTLGSTARGSEMYVELPEDVYAVIADPKMMYIVAVGRSQLHRLVRGATNTDVIEGNGQILSVPAFRNEGDKVWCYWVRSQGDQFYLEARNLGQPSKDAKSIAFDTASGVPNKRDLPQKECLPFNVAVDPSTGGVWVLGSGSDGWGAAFSFDVVNSASRGGWIRDFCGRTDLFDIALYNRTPVSFVNG
ncbi:hypothetical protein [Streptomyces sp. NPDC017988]|uniref:hypothetical protein n=1 Tax=Streptomyces sp. NPDC017988 TaxID=3365025 RepID=UPI00378A7630